MTLPIFIPLSVIKLAVITITVAPLAVIWNYASACVRISSLTAGLARGRIIKPICLYSSFGQVVAGMVTRPKNSHLPPNIIFPEKQSFLSLLYFSLISMVHWPTIFPFLYAGLHSNANVKSFPVTGRRPLLDPQKKVSLIQSLPK